MKQQEVFKKIGGIIREINEQYEYLETVEGPLNELELELMVANSHFLTDHIEILRKLNAHAAAAPAPQLPVAEVTAPPPAPINEPRYFEPFQPREEEATDVPEPVIYLEETPAQTIEFDMARPAEDHTDHFPVAEEAEIAAPEPIAIPEPEISPEPQWQAPPESETIRHELTLDDIGGDWDEDDEEEPAIAEPVVPTPATEPAPVATIPVYEPEPAPAPVAVVPEPEPEPIKPEPVLQRPEPAPEPVVVLTPAVTTEPQPAITLQTQVKTDDGQVLTLNQRISAQLGTPNRMADHLQLQPISDLKSAISLNDKLMYIKELFNGYGLAYSEAIDNLNRFKSFEEAESFLKSTYSVKNNWQDKPATADRFFALLQRRYL